MRVGSSIFFVFLAVALSACHRANVDADESAPKVQGQSVQFAKDQMPPGISTATVSSGKDSSLTLNGRIVWDEDHTVRVFSPFSGRVARIVANVGDRVRAGDVLALVDSPDYGQAQADFRKAEAEKKVAVASLNRARDLFDHGVVAAKDVEEAESNAAAANAECDRAAQVLRTFADRGAQVDQRMALRSPIDGSVVQRDINPGAELRTDQSGVPLFTVTDPKTHWIALDAHAEDLPLLKLGQTVEFAPNSVASEHDLQAQIVRIDRYLDSSSRTIKVIARTDGQADADLKAEAFVTAHIATSGVSQPTIAADAVYLLGTDHYAFVKEGTAFVRHAVSIGEQRDGVVTILSGLNPGDAVVTHGALYLQQLLQTAR